MTRILTTLKTMGKFQIFGLICGIYCSVVTALVMTAPHLAQLLLNRLH